VAENGCNDHCGLLINSTRQIIYASKGKDFAESARQAALQNQTAMKKYI
jgi:orotidine-5'-phosphate decarboxylase